MLPKILLRRRITALAVVIRWTPTKTKLRKTWRRLVDSVSAVATPIAYAGCVVLRRFSIVVTSFRYVVTKLVTKEWRESTKEKGARQCTLRCYECNYNVSRVLFIVSHIAPPLPWFFYPLPSTLRPILTRKWKANEKMGETIII